MKTLLFAAFVAFAANASASDLSNRQDVHGNTALMVAAATGDVELTRTLIEAGAEVDARGRIGNTALIYAAQEGHAGIVKMLVKAGANITAHNDYQVTAGNLAKGYGHRDIAEMLETVTLQAAHEMQQSSRI
ncbi:MAG: ankyrin repeat protein [Candidatus Latescibacterota bacterium]|jgi:ankyrin repeat protein